MLRKIRNGVFLLALLCLAFGGSSIANAYTVYDCWISQDGWGESATNFTTNSDFVYFNVSCNSYYTFISNKWYRPNGTQENDIGTSILAHPVYDKGLFVGFYAWMVIEGKDREPGEWRVEHWAQDAYSKWHLMCTKYFTITEVPKLFVSSDGNCGAKTPCYDSIQDAIDDASTESIILVKHGTYTESISLGSAKSLVIKGGYDSTYDQQTPNSTYIQGIGQTTIQAPSGSLKFQMIILKHD